MTKYDRHRQTDIHASVLHIYVDMTTWIHAVVLTMLLLPQIIDTVPLSNDIRTNQNKSESKRGKKHHKPYYLSISIMRGSLRLGKSNEMEEENITDFIKPQSDPDYLVIKISPD